MEYSGLVLYFKELNGFITTRTYILCDGSSKGKCPCEIET